MTNSEMKKAAQFCRAALMTDGVWEMQCVMVLFAMVTSRVGYWEALGAWADYSIDPHWDQHRWHREFCRYLLRAGIEEHPERYFERKAGEVMIYEN